VEGGAVTLERMSGREAPVTTEACAIAALKTGAPCGAAGSTTVPPTALAAAPPRPATVPAAALEAPPLPTLLAAAPPRDSAVATVPEAHRRTAAAAALRPAARGV
jgi:hypothetical protein